MTRATRMKDSFRIAEPIVSPAALVAGLGLYGVHVGTLRWGRAAWANPVALRTSWLSHAPSWARYAVPGCFQHVLF